MLRVPRKGPLMRASGGVLILALIAAVAIVAQTEAVHRLRAADFAADTRAAAFPSLIVSARAFFPLGAGFGSFSSVYPAFEPNALLSTIYLNEAHDEPVQLAIEGGLPALILLLVFILWWLRTAGVVALRGGGANQGLARAAVAVTALLMLSSLVDYPLRTPLLASLFTFSCVAMAIAARPREHAER